MIFPIKSLGEGIVAGGSSGAYNKSKNKTIFISILSKWVMFNAKWANLQLNHAEKLVFLMRWCNDSCFYPTKQT